MKKSTIIKPILFVVLLAALLLGMTKIFTAKFTNNNCQSYTAAQLYEQKNNSIEVAIGGSSQAVFCINAEELYQKYGISSYATGSPNQAILVSLGWLRELNKNQDIKVAVLDASQLYETVEESFYRQTLDTMKFSSNKLDIVRQHIAESEDADSLTSYIFPLIKYHSRWGELEEQDFNFSTKNSPMFRGVRLADYVYSFESWDDMTSDSLVKPEMVDYQVSAFRQYAQYCKDNNIELLLIKTPKEDWTDVKEQGTQELCDELGVTYVSYATKKACKAMGLNYYSDFKDPQHLNVRGSTAVGSALADYLHEHYDLTDFRETDLAESAEYQAKYQKKFADAMFQTNSDVAEYLNTLSEDYLSTGDYDLLVQLTDDSITSAWTDEMQKALETCGFRTDISALQNTAYAGAVIKGETGNAKEATQAFSDIELTDENGEETTKQMEFNGTFGNGFPFVCTSTPDGTSASKPRIMINYVRKYISNQGLNFFLYNNKTGEILDTPTASLCSDGKLRLLRPTESKWQ